VFILVIAKCKECGKEYQLESNEKPSDFQCDCGGELSSKEAVVTPTKIKKPTQERKSWKERADDVKSGKMELNELFEYDEKASRIELFVRILYAIPVGIILFLYGIIAGIFLVLQWLIILFLGKRSESFNDFIKGYLQYYVHLISYFSLMTDKRPGVTPIKVKIFELRE
jgi:hypothetical protein